MLEEILMNLSEDELLSLLPEQTVKFVMELAANKVEEEGDDKARLASMVAALYGVEFVLNKNLRSRLIESLSPASLIKLFYADQDNNDNEKLINPQHYEALIEWADSNLKDFSDLLGMGEEYEVVLGIPTAIEGISLISPEYPLYEYQAQISKEVKGNYQQGQTRQLIHLPTGAGKTRTAMNIVAEHLRDSPSNLVLWLADREELCVQAFEEFEKAWTILGNRETTAYGFYSNAHESLGGITSGFVVAGLQKFSSVRKSASRQVQLLYRELNSRVSLVIFDEAHKAVAETYKEVIKDFIEAENFKALLLGLTATPGRNFSIEGMTEDDQALSNFFHENKVSMKIPGYLSPIDYLVEEGYLAKADFKSLNYEQSSVLAYEISSGYGGVTTLKALANSVERNERILNTIKEECEAGSYVIVFACTVEHARGIATALSLMGIKAASIDGGDSVVSRRMKIQQYKQGKLQVLVNFNVLTAGFDAPITNVAVIARPMNSLVQYLQMAGRAMRGKKSGGNDICRIYTVMDEIPQFQSIAIGFSHWNEMWREES